MNQVIEQNYNFKGEEITAWFYLGAEEVVRNKKYLNSINVFPVADGDTGSNLSVTVNAMAKKGKVDSSFRDALAAISASGLASARGNSGMIFASYFGSLSEEIKEHTQITFEIFAKACVKAVERLYDIIEEPVEGTMLTVMKDWANYLLLNYKNARTAEHLFEAAYAEASRSLEKTKAQMQVLRKQKVFDSGAVGFVKFLNGINRYYNGESPGEIIEEQQLAFSTEIQYDSKFRFCTQFLVKLKQLEDDVQVKVKYLLRPFGDSVIVNTSSEYLHVHIHTMVPEIVLELLLPFGEILDQKIDDMVFQEKERNHKKRKIGLLTDSIADIPSELKEKYFIHTYSLGILWEDVVYLDKGTINNEILFKKMKDSSSFPTSSQPEQARALAKVETMLEEYESVLIVTVADQLSGTYQCFQRIAKELDPLGERVKVIDSRLNSGAQGLLVLEAAEWLEEGSDLDTVVERLEKSREKISIYVCLETLENAVRSGRISKNVGAIGKMIGLRPIMSLDERGKGKTFKAAFSKKGISKKIFRLMEKESKENRIKSYSIVHGCNAILAEEYKDKMKKLTGIEPEFVTDISSIIGMYSGPNSVALCVCRK